MSAERFGGKALIVTGTTGIGEAAARLARAEGAAGRDEEDSEWARDALTARP